MNEQVIFERINEVSDRLAAVELSNAVYVQHSNDIVRRIESYHNNQKDYKNEIKTYIADQNKIQVGDIKEHLNKVFSLHREDLDRVEKKTDKNAEDIRFAKKIGYAFAAVVAYATDIIGKVKGWM